MKFLYFHCKIYIIEQRNLETKKLFNDGEHILYVYGEFRDDSDIGKLMHDFSCPNPADMNFKLMKDTTSYYKENPKGVEVMCRAFEEVRDEAREQTLLEKNRKMMKKLKFSAQQAMDMMDLSYAEQEKLLSKI